MSAAASFEQRVAPGVRVTFEADRVADRIKNATHETLIIDNAHFGRMIISDGAVKSSSADQFIYHEMMSHVPLLAHGHVERVLILGAGSGWLAEQVLKHRDVRTVVQVEADPLMVKLARSYFAGINTSVFNDRRFMLRIAEGAEFVASTDERFDLLLVDSVDSGGTGLCLLTESFLRNARGCLKSGGLLISRLGIPFLQPLAFSAAMKRQCAVFPLVSTFLVPVPSVLGGPVAIGWASNVLAPDAAGIDVVAARFADARIETRYYTPEVHRAAFALPRYIKDVVTDAARPGEEAETTRLVQAQTRALVLVPDAAAGTSSHDAKS